MENIHMILDLERSAVPFTYRFFGLRLRLAFTKRRFERAEARYIRHLTATALDTARLLQGIDQQPPAGQGRNGAAGGNREFLQVLENSFSSLRSEIDRIEESQEEMKERALPLVREQLASFESFMRFLSGFSRNEASRHPENACLLPMLNQGDETTTAIKQLIAAFAGVPIGMCVHDLRRLETLLRHTGGYCEACHKDDPAIELSETEGLTSVGGSVVHEVHVVELAVSNSILEEEPR